MARKKKSGPTYYTTYQVSQTLGVSLPTVVNWVNSGLLHAHRTPGGHRRIARNDLIAFAREYNYPLSEDFLAEGAGQKKVLIVADERDFVGRAAIESELKDGTSRWTTVGLAVDWHDYERVYSEAGLVPPRHEVYSEGTMSVYRRSGIEWDYAGYASSFTTSSLLRTPLAIAKVPLDLAQAGSEVDLEVSVVRRPRNVLARVQSMPFFNPARKTATLDAGDRHE